jgi:hypothetical protein
MPLEEIIARSDGAPPFLEQVTRAVLDTEDGNAFEGKPCEQAPAAPERRVPATLQASLIERLDRLGRRSGLLAEKKRVSAQLGSLQGSALWPLPHNPHE